MQGLDELRKYIETNSIETCNLDKLMQLITSLGDGETYDVLVHRFVEGEKPWSYDWFCNIYPHEYSEKEGRVISMSNKSVKVHYHKSPTSAVFTCAKKLIEELGNN